MNFHEELERLINKRLIESGSNTPDSILADFILGCLKAFDQAVKDRDKWYPKEEIHCPGVDVGKPEVNADPSLLIGEMSAEEAIVRVEKWLEYYSMNLGGNPADEQALDFIKSFLRFALVPKVTEERRFDFLLAAYLRPVLRPKEEASQ